MEAITPFLFWVLAGLTGVCAIATVATQNIVRSATWLLFTLAGTSGIFFLLGADLVGAIQLLVYVGGTMVLVVFGVMLTAQGPFLSMKTSGSEWAISTLVGICLYGVLVLSILSVGRPAAPASSLTAIYAPRQALSSDVETAPYTTVIGTGLLGVGVGPAHSETLPGQETRVIRTNYLFLFEIVSVHLLVVLIGAAYLARAKRRREATI